MDPNINRHPKPQIMLRTAPNFSNSTNRVSAHSPDLHWCVTLLTAQGASTFDRDVNDNVAMSATSHWPREESVCHMWRTSASRLAKLSLHSPEEEEKKTITTPNHPSDFPLMITIITLLRLALCVGAFHELIEQCLFFSFGVMNISGDSMGF